MISMHLNIYIYVYVFMYTYKWVKIGSFPPLKWDAPSSTWDSLQEFVSGLAGNGYEKMFEDRRYSCVVNSKAMAVWRYSQAGWITNKHRNWVGPLAGDKAVAQPAPFLLWKDTFLYKDSHSWVPLEKTMGVVELPAWLFFTQRVPNCHKLGPITSYHIMHVIIQHIIIHNKWWICPTNISTT